PSWQLEEFLNRSSPFSIWVNGERVDELLEREQRQERQREELEERFGLLEDGVDDIFQDSTRVYGRLAPFFQPPFGGFREAFLPPPARLARELHPFGRHPARGFHHLFQPLFELTQRMLDVAGSALRRPGLGFLGNERMVCREIRRNSAGCLRLRDECEKCREILAVDCSQADPAGGALREQFEDALRLAERFTRRYDELLGAFQAELLNTSSLLQQLERQFGWVSRLANLTQGSDGFLGGPQKNHP
uniref:Clusterin C-terminal domain-containing protein n=1 Tax=Anser brachyrhynchus TaxID=132585 RepID=A0A8B9BG14_9AVES